MARSKSNQGRPVPRVLIVDDHPAVREALAICISRQPDLEVCGEAEDTAKALQLVGETDPDIAVIDIALKNGNGIDLIKRIKARNARVRAIVWSMYGEDLYAERALRAGAMGYITKEQATDQIIVAIRQVLEGNVYLSPAMTQKLLKRAVEPTAHDSGREPVDALTDRELQVFGLIGQGLKTREVAAQLHLSTKTIETYRDRIREKLNLAGAADLARCAFQWALEMGKSPRPG